MKKCFLIIEMNTGAMDGFYFPEELARESLAYLREEYPWGSFVLTEIQDMTEGTRLPDNMFWLNRLKKWDAA